MNLRNSLISGIGVSKPGQLLSIKEVAFKTVQFLYALEAVDPVFSSFSYVPKRKKQTEFVLKDYEKGELVLALANCILDDKKGDIRYYEKDGKPTIDYKRNFGFGSLLNFKMGRKVAFSLQTCSGGDNEFDGFHFTYFSSGFEFPYEWFVKVLEAMVKHEKPLYGSIYLKSSRLNSLNIKAKWSIGLGSYFSPKLEWIIDGIEVERHHVEGVDGSFVYPLFPDLMKDKETYDAAIDKLISLNNLITKGDNIRSY